MRYSFNLIDNPWLPCLMLDGSHLELGLRETLFKAREILEIRAGSPLETVAIKRLLLAIIHRNFGPSGYDAWQAIWENGRGFWDAEVLEKYFQKYYQRFDLFDLEHPFYQTAGFEAKKISPISRLYHELASGNNATLFDHSLDTNPVGISPAKAASVLVAHQAFAIGGGKSDTGYTRNGPLVGGVVALFKGRNLFETLMLNLVRYSSKMNEPIPADIERDKPAWEWDEGINPGQARLINGYLDLLTWQSRAIRLLPEGDLQNPFVYNLYYAQGEAFNEIVKDPQIPMKIDEKRGELRLRLNPSRALWRDSTAVIHRRTTFFKAVLASDWVANLIAFGYLERRNYGLRVVGLATDPKNNAKILMWRDEEWNLPSQYLENPDLAERLWLELSLADKGEKAIWRALFTLAMHLLYPEDKLEDNTNAKKKADNAGEFMKRFGAQREFWIGMEQHFWKLVAGLVEDADEARKQWVESIRMQAQAALGNELSGRGYSSRNLKALVRAQTVLNYDLSQL